MILTERIFAPRSPIRENTIWFPKLFGHQHPLTPFWRKKTNIWAKKKIFHQPRFSWNSRGFPFQRSLPFGGKSVVWGRGLIWPDPSSSIIPKLKKFGPLTCPPFHPPIWDGRALLPPGHEWSCSNSRIFPKKCQDFFAKNWLTSLHVFCKKRRREVKLFPHVFTGFRNKLSETGFPRWNPIASICLRQNFPQKRYRVLGTGKRDLFLTMVFFYRRFPMKLGDLYTVWKTLKLGRQLLCISGEFGKDGGPRSQRGPPENGKSLKNQPQVSRGYLWVIYNPQESLGVPQ